MSKYDDSEPQSLGVLLRLAHQHFSSAVEDALHQSGFGDLRPHHANVFSFVPPAGIQVSELTMMAGVRKQSMAQAVEELEKLGYVERRPHPSDKRARLVFLTERGRQIRPLAMNSGKRVEESWAKLLGERELDKLRSALQALLVKL
ncbi:MarR family transcriptional regulator (plasmid) [Roseibium aggregatum]|jgi:DNA-binding MarR family transcriptional regulator|uniref:MarR family winged helix-turn-helix transcriptional regulator n=1 Tax=Roseibium aggregatum TaxID=187304 RepID=UPI001E455B1D|nr:MarR family transcriptional regulator [Roseibium aggregatum]UES59953.1 MarR family transcriptional regulator [Roseibium aggregatum]